MESTRVNTSLESIFVNKMHVCFNVRVCPYNVT